MGILDNLERNLERVVNGAFAKAFRSGLQPVEITAALRRELDTKAAVLSRDRIIAPNTFIVRLAPADYERMHAMGDTLIDELVRLVAKHAESQHYQFAGGIKVTLKSDSTLTVGMVAVDSENISGHVTWVAVLDINGTRHPLTKSRTVIGRGTEADITVDDSGISRRHIEILWDGTRAQANDLGSTNGSKLNGERLVSAALPADSVITIGQTSITLHLMPQASTTAESTSGGGAGGFWGPRE
ncbi:MAG: protein FhaA [Actinomycetota bacterium]